ncbi:MAG: aminoglycoside 6-adenylyltransferase [Ignavibacteria bacterium]|nr:aminoglycoside 6-adenylyltransferase [Ignavibacteria bacterium]
MTSNESIPAIFAKRITEILEADSTVIGLTVGGSWLANEIDEFSDLDLILVTKEKISGNADKMKAYASGFGKLLSAFTGEHIGDPRVLICLYDEPLLHVDIKFLTIEEFGKRVESPVILLDKGGELRKIIDSTEAKFPRPDFQWIEDRFWIWIHYALLKIGRGEYFESFDFFGSLRSIVLGPLLHMKSNSKPRGVRKLEFISADEDIKMLKATLPAYDRESLLSALNASVSLYRKLRLDLYGDNITFRTEAEERVMKYFDEISAR